MIRAVYVAVLMLAASPGWSQTTRLQLAPDNYVTVEGEVADSISLPLKCNSSGTVLMRLAESEHFRGGPILRIASDGKRTVRYRVQGLDRVPDGGIIDFAFSGENDVAILVATPPKGDEYVLTFDEDGKLKSTLQLDTAGWRSRHFAPLADGGLLALGAETSKTDPKRQSQAIWAFDASGSRSHRVVLSKDLLQPAAGAKASEKAEFNQSLAFSALQQSSDGRIYIMHYGQRGLVHVLSPSLELLTTIKPKVPEPGYLEGLHEHAGRILLTLVKLEAPGSPEIAEVQLQEYGVDGKLSRSFFQRDPALGSAFACYDGQSFTFVGVGHDSRLRLVHALPSH